jgi:hypothetical protein
VLEHDPEKWKPVFRKDHAQSKRGDHDAIPSNRIMIYGATELSSPAKASDPAITDVCVYRQRRGVLDRPLARL